jgi:ankyrin repeat protein
MRASSQGHTATVQALIGAGADCTIEKIRYARTLHLGALEGHSTCGYEQQGKTAASVAATEEIKKLFPKGTF